MQATLLSINRYPVKSLPAERIDAAILCGHRGVPWDRVFAIAPAQTQFDAERPQWLPRKNFLFLAENPLLASLRQSFDESTRLLTLSHGGLQATANPSSAAGRTLLSGFLQSVLPDAHRHVTLVYTGGISLTDTQRGAISIINRATLAAIEAECAMSIEPARFRGNLLIEAPPWAELAWLDQLLRVGPACLKVLEPIERCAAINVNPFSAKRDLNLPPLMKRRYGHINCGVLCEVVRAGRIRPGDDISIAAERVAMAGA